MIAVVVVSHGPLAQALVSTALDLAGPQADVIALGLDADESPEAFATRLRRCLAGLAGGLLLLSDLQGGTPHRTAVMLARELGVQRQCALVSGVNLAMLCEALVLRDSARPLDEIARHVARVGAEQVRVLSEENAGML